MGTSAKYKSEFQFLGSSVKELEIKNDFVVFPENSKKSFDVVYQRCDITRTDKNKLGSIRLDIKVMLEENRQICDLHLLIEGCFRVSLDMADDEFEALLKINGCAALYSVARAYIISISSNTFMKGAIILPMMNFVEASKDEH